MDLSGNYKIMAFYQWEKEKCALIISHLLEISVFQPINQPLYQSEFLDL